MNCEMWTGHLTERTAIRIFLKDDAPFADLVASEKGATMTIHCCIADLIDLREEIDKILAKRKAQRVTQKETEESKRQ